MYVLLVEMVPMRELARDNTKLPKNPYDIRPSWSNGMRILTIAAVMHCGEAGVGRAAEMPSE